MFPFFLWSTDFFSFFSTELLNGRLSFWVKFLLVLCLPHRPRYDRVCAFLRVYFCAKAFFCYRCGALSLTLSGHHQIWQVCYTHVPLRISTYKRCTYIITLQKPYSRYILLSGCGMHSGLCVYLDFNCNWLDKPYSSTFSSVVNARNMPHRAAITKL